MSEPSDTPAAMPADAVNNFWLNGEHFTTDSGDEALAFSEQIGRLAWLQEQFHTQASVDIVGRALDRLETLLNWQVEGRRPVTKAANLTPVTRIKPL